MKNDRTNSDRSEAEEAPLESATMVTSDPHRRDLSSLVLYYEGEMMVPRGFSVRQADGAVLPGVKRLVIEVTQHQMPRLLEMDAD